MAFQAVSLRTKRVNRDKVKFYLHGRVQIPFPSIQRDSSRDPLRHVSKVRRYPFRTWYMDTIPILPVSVPGFPGFRYELIAFSHGPGTIRTNGPTPRSSCVLPSQRTVCSGPLYGPVVCEAQSG